MKSVGLRAWLFGGAGMAAMLFLAWFDTPVSNIDRHTGEQKERGGRLLVRTRPPRAAPPRDVLVQARDTGDARRALEVLREHGAHTKMRPALRDIARVLEREVGSPPASVRAAPLREMQRLAGAAPAPGVVAAVIERMEDSRDVREDVERFFAPTAGGNPLSAATLAGLVAKWTPADRIASEAIAAAPGNADTVTPAVARIVAQSFAGAGRRRGRLRWLVRGWRLAPADVTATTALVDALLEYESPLAAHCVLEAAQTAGLDTTSSWRRRAQIAAWLDRPELETAALRKLLDSTWDQDANSRLLDLCAYVGDTSGAARAALAVAELEPSPETFGRAAQHALADYRVDDAIALYERAAALDADPLRWHRRVVQVLLQDLRVDEAIERVRARFEMRADAASRRELESLLRATRRTGDLADLLEGRFREDPDPALRAELVGLLLALGRRDRLRDLERERMQAMSDPLEFFAELATFRGTGVPGLPERTTEMVRSQGLTDEGAGTVLGVLQALAAEPDYAPALRAFAERFGDRTATAQMLLVAVDRAGNPTAVARAAESLWRTYPARSELLTAWIERAGWAGLTDMEIRARDVLRARHPIYADNLRRLGDLLEALGNADDALTVWREVAALEGPGGPSEDRLVAALSAAGREDEALDLLTARAGRAGGGTLGVADRVALAERLFGGQRVDAALPLYESVLAEDDTHLLSLLRIGQARAWGNDPSGAVPYLERLVELTDTPNGEEHFLLGETYWATLRNGEGERAHRQALPLLLEPATRTPLRESMAAKVFARLGRTDDALALYTELIDADPRNVNLMLDLGDAMLASHRVTDARSAVERARPLAPDDRRLLRLDGQVAIEERRYEAAVLPLRCGLDLYGPDAGFESDLGRALEPLGRWREAHAAYERALELQPDNRDVAFMRRAIADRLSNPSLEAAIRTLDVADDSTRSERVEGTLLLDCDRWRLSAMLDQTSTSGRAQAFRRGRKSVDADIETFSLALSHRFDAQWEFGGGLDMYSGRDEGDDTGFWLGVGRALRDPYRAFSLRLHANEVLDEPAAAAGLGGSSDGIRAEIFRETADQWWWGSAALGVERLSIEHPRRGTLTDRRLRGELAIGRWLRRTGPDITERLRVRKLPTTYEGTTVAGEPAMADGPRVAAWLAYQPVRLGDGQDLAGPIPLGTDFDYLSANARAVDHLTACSIWEVEASIGTDLRDGGVFGNVRAGWAWRPTEEFEIRLGASYGQALGRSGGGEGATSIQLAVTLRW